MRILAIGAQPGDVEHACAGVLARYASGGHAVTIAVATTGATAALSGTADEAGRIRREETEAACAVIGADLIWLGNEDEFLTEDKPTRMSVIDAIRSVGPDVLLVPSELEDHPDRRAAARLGSDARIPAAMPLLGSHHGPVDIPTTFVMDTRGGRRFEPHGFADISDTIDLKQTMVECHVTQRTWAKAILGVDTAEDMLRLARMRGHQAGVRHAEAFQLVLGPPATEGWALLPSTRGDDT
ncbi:PIG-L deacetylase family protein [Microbacterium saperdae]|uniref:LmbE family N-acetylglucosaminyl deacetylase n=1 Tax=Microbacterium saperdae TaxID=69368 RepID=A0A543BIT1_9MICO|nr:PIG-L family deacetylase [Microbacterium saperdae]TQL84757.1 LmbE family N-acetylglucosaminyl deacetylase [Microbacterium saperdae]GGM64273.1 hypothetical protein GCM10010489_39910 [Microbacterium saperdae]